MSAPDLAFCQLSQAMFYGYMPSTAGANPKRAAAWPYLPSITEGSHSENDGT